MATRNMNLTEGLDRFVDQQIESGAYQNASEVLRAGLRLLKAEEEAHAAKLERLKAAIQVGIDAYERGEGEVVGDLEDYFDELEAEIEAELENERRAPTPAK